MKDTEDTTKKNRRIRPKDSETSAPAHQVSDAAPSKISASRTRLSFTAFLRPFRVLFFALRGPALALLRITLAILLVAAGFSAYRLVDSYARTAEHFAVTSVEVDGNERLAEHEVLQIAGIELGQNVFDVTPSQAKERLEDASWIAEAMVTRRLPGTLRVSIRERRAVAVLALGAHNFLVGDDASVFKTVEPGDVIDYPLITGLSESRFVEDTEFRTRVLLDAITLMHEYRAAGLAEREALSEIHLGPEGASLVVGDDAFVVRIGRGAYRRKFRRLRSIMDRLDVEESRPEYVLLDNQRREDRVTVRLRQREAPPELESAEPEAEDA